MLCASVSSRRLSATFQLRISTAPAIFKPPCHDAVTDVGIVLSARAVACAVLEIPSGIFADIIGRRSTLIAATAVRLAACLYLFLRYRIARSRVRTRQNVGAVLCGTFCIENQYGNAARILLRVLCPLSRTRLHILTFVLFPRLKNAQRHIS
jgi:MFS family permease